MQKVSIICSTWNRADILPLAIESALHQTYPNWELIITDDGSTDDTKKVVKRYQKADKRIIYINQGKSKYYTINRNRGIKKASGELMCFFDDDSVHHPEFILEHIVRHNTPDVLISYSGRQTVMGVDPATVTYDQVPSLPSKAIPFIQYEGQTETLNGVLDVGDYMVKSSVMKALKGFTEEKDFPSYCSDLKLVDQILKSYPEGKIVMIPRRLHVNFMFSHDHMTKRKLDAREEGKMVDEIPWEWF